jgi:hypothetical protein
VGVLLGNGDGTFQAPVAYPSGGLRVSSVAVADVNGDGKPDVVVANCAPDESGNCEPGGRNGLVGVLLGNGDGTFQTAVNHDSGGFNARSLAVTDVNGDGKPDVVVANCAPSESGRCSLVNGLVGVLLGNGDGTFKLPTTYDTGGYYADSVAVADLNGDGKPDVVVANSGSSTLGVLLNNTPTCATPAVITLSAMPSYLWPPNGKMVPVAVSGTITDPGCSVKSAAYAVTDEYGEVQPSGPVTVGPEGAYSFTVWLQASRLGTDLEGRLYAVIVSASNNAGKTGSKVANVVVPHDLGH